MGAGISEQKQQSLPRVTESYTEIYTLTRLNHITSIALNPDEQMLAIGSDNKL
ncbi:hypothetical protein [Nostoc sp.]